MSATRTANQEKMSRIIRERSDSQLLIMHAACVVTYREAAEGDDMAALMVLIELEMELERRGFAICEICGEVEHSGHACE